MGYLRSIQRRRRLLRLPMFDPCRLDEKEPNIKSKHAYRRQSQFIYLDAKTGLFGLYTEVLVIRPQISFRYCHRPWTKARYLSTSFPFSALTTNLRTPKNSPPERESIEPRLGENSFRI